MPPATRPQLTWRDAIVARSITETPTARSIVFEIPGWDRHRAGQHIDMRLTADDGYQATRSYSLSSGPNEAPQITVERVDDGEVSPFLVDVVVEGDTLEVRGPIGGYFIWEPRNEPLLLIGGGSGVAPLRSMWRASTTEAPITILYSTRSQDRVIYRDELAERPGTVNIHLTREEAAGFITGRIDSDAITAVVDPGAPPHAYVCGPTAFVEAITQFLTPLIHDRTRVRTERFG